MTELSALETLARLIDAWPRCPRCRLTRPGLPANPQTGRWAVEGERGGWPCCDEDACNDAARRGYIANWRYAQREQETASPGEVPAEMTTVMTLGEELGVLRHEHAGADAVRAALVLLGRAT